MCLFVAGLKDLECSGTFQTTLDTLLAANKLPKFSLGDVVTPNFSVLSGILANSTNTPFPPAAACASGVSLQSDVLVNSSISSEMRKSSYPSSAENGETDSSVVDFRGIYSGATVESSTRAESRPHDATTVESSIAEDESFIDDQFEEVVNSRRSVGALAPSIAAPAADGVASPAGCAAVVASVRGRGSGRGGGHGRGGHSIPRYRKRLTRATSTLAIGESLP